ncbi:hypothetical protein Dde_2180 [Oleidesulfovibrio alaskensis G20]|uniref:Uncharacterized protein n=1 Tax=Oleidesulfovibrio alaskensis (strain ATCC BAA-1058 / DSM 17464 / G20) TaxID=207559 RepID=Q30ZB9_OLEA2|nr:hypothetical protein [Oleidesulfovibrio alaskensis]ABB38977.1 hypothetical protein Dde_2180 [Oleidesulfovibrio alaskensis G20]MBG0772240.1 hypothetical protein [Oleidesulfovibrio alaskensis]
MILTSVRRGLAVCLFLLLVPLAAGAAEEGFVQQFEQGTVDWCDGVVRAEGTAIAPASAVSLPRARALALRAAVTEARGRLLHTVRSVQVTPGITAGDMLDAGGALSEFVRGQVQNSRIDRQDFLADGSARVVVSIALRDGLLGQFLAPALPFKVAASPVSGRSVPASEVAEPQILQDGEFSGVVIDARGTGALPALMPVVVLSGGETVYGVRQAVRRYALERGLAVYVTDGQAAAVAAVAGSAPLTLRAAAVQESAPSVIVLDDPEAQLLYSPAAVKSLAACRVVVLLDAVF